MKGKKGRARRGEREGREIVEYACGEGEEEGEGRQQRVDQRGREKNEGKRVESEIETKREAVTKGEGESCSV